MKITTTLLSGITTILCGGFTMTGTVVATVVNSGCCDSGDHARIYEFFWRGQFAGFSVNGCFSYDVDDVPANGIVREEHLEKLDVSFYSPNGTLLRTYEDNHLTPTDESGNPWLNFAFYVHSEELLQDGTWNVDDDELMYRNGFLMGEGNATFKGQNGIQEGLAFWSRPFDNKPPHLHVDDWNDKYGDGEFEFPIGYSSHEDASFNYQTTQEKIDGGKVGKAYYDTDEDGSVIVNKLASDVNAFGQPVRVRPAYCIPDTAKKCFDHPKFRYTITRKGGEIDKGGCDFVARNKNKKKQRCRQKRKGKKVSDWCPETCDNC